MVFPFQQFQHCQFTESFNNFLFAIIKRISYLTNSFVTFIFWHIIIQSLILKNDCVFSSFQDISTSLPYNPYWTLPYKLQSSEENQTAHTIHSLSYSKLCNYETIIPSPDILMARPFSFPNYKEEVPTKKSKRHKKIRFTPTIVKTKKNKFIVTSVPESTLLKTSINEEML